MLSHEFLWSPTPIYYIMTFIIFFGIRKKLNFKSYTIIPFMSIPATLDYISKFYIFLKNFIEREYYVGSFQEDKKRLTQVRKTVASIVDEKKKHVSFE